MPKNSIRPRCVWCDRVKTLLKDNGYEVTEKSIVDESDRRVSKQVQSDSDSTTSSNR